MCLQGGQTIFNCVFNKLDHGLEHTSCTMGKTFEKVFDTMPCEYKGRFLQYNLLKRHIFLYVKGACQCSVKREIEEACSPFSDLEAAAVLYSLQCSIKREIEEVCSPFGDLEAAAVLCSLQCSVKREIEEACSPFGDLEVAAVLCSLRRLPARYTEEPCSYCGLPELHEGNQLQKEMSDGDDPPGGAVHDPAQGGPNQRDLKRQISEFESLLRKELLKIDGFFNLLHLQYIGRMKELDTMRSQEESRQNRLRSEGRELWIDPEIELEKIRQCMKTTAAKIDLLASYCTLNRTALIEILKKHDEETGSYISGKFSDLVQKMDFVCYVRAVEQDAKFCLSLLGSSTGSSSSVAPPMSSRGKNLWLSLQQKRVQFLSSSDGNFDYIEAAKVAKDAIAHGLQQCELQQ